MAKRIIIAVICLAMLTVVGVVVFSLTYDEEAIVKEKMDKMAREYYEEYVYDGLIDEGMGQSEIEEKMALYKDRGFSEVRLRQLLLKSKQKDEKDEAMIKKYCDVNNTQVTFYPEEPFNKESYRVEFKYDCDF